jgi:hypothetical protein
MLSFGYRSLSGQISGEPILTIGNPLLRSSEFNIIPRILFSRTNRSTASFETGSIGASHMTFWIDSGVFNHINIPDYNIPLKDILYLPNLLYIKQRSVPPSNPPQNECYYAAEELAL